ncbi:cytochrome b [Anaplasmataceae bacterium AB001_6]|nr:cytochrome b [Anaplasmataceae bacterium AB001_6]
MSIISCRNNKYNLLMRLLHWIVGLMVIGVLISGMITHCTAINVNKAILFKYHKAVGFCILLLMVIRILVRMISDIPAWPKKLKKSYKYMSLAVQYGMYIFVTVAALSGYVMSSASGKDIRLLWNMEKTAPLIVAKDKAVAQKAHKIHTTVVWIVLALVILHFLGSMKHIIIDRYNILRRML